MKPSNTKYWQEVKKQHYYGSYEKLWINTSKVIDHYNFILVTPAEDYEDLRKCLLPLIKGIDSKTDTSLNIFDQFCKFTVENNLLNKTWEENKILFILANGELE